MRLKCTTKVTSLQLHNPTSIKTNITSNILPINGAWCVPPASSSRGGATKARRFLKKRNGLSSNRLLLMASSVQTFSSLQCRNEQQICKVGRYRLPTAYLSNWHPYPPMNNTIVGGKQVVLPPLSMDTGKQTWERSSLWVTLLVIARRISILRQ